jgi:flagellar assembly protein FliH
VSSNPAAAWSPYAFAQLDAPVTINEVGDVLAEAERQAQQLREAGRTEGYTDGHAAGLAAAREQALPALAALTQAAAEFSALREQLIDDLERDAIAFALDLAEQILAGALDVEPERVLDVARHALRHLADRRRVTLIVHPDDLAMLTAAAPELEAELGGIEHLAVQADRRVNRGGAVARTEEGEIDAGITVALEHARELVATTLGGTRGATLMDGFADEF